MIDIKSLSKSYGSKAVLQGVTTSISAGEVVGIVGLNGAGKTTLFHCITELTKYQGEVRLGLDGKKPLIGYLETNPNHMSHITGREYLTLMCVARGRDIPDFDKQNVFDLPLDEYASNYSTGMKKKLGFLSLIIQRNDIFILDEPFNGVDLQGNMVFESWIIELKQRGKTILISSHIVSTLTTICDRILVLSEGVIAADLPPNLFSQLDHWLSANNKGEGGKQVDFS